MGKMIDVIQNNQKIPAYTVDAVGDIKGGLIVIHEVWGLTDHIKDVAERFGQRGFQVLAPDLLVDTGIEEKVTPDIQEALFSPDAERRNAIQPKLREIMTPIRSPEFGERAMIQLQACFDYLYSQPVVKQKVAVVGYCFGGTHSFNLAVEEERLVAAVPFYGHADQSVEELSKIKCPILAFYGEKDEGLISKLPELEKNMGAAGVDFRPQVYPNCGHAFFNDTNQFAYNEQAAQDAWQKTLNFLTENLG